MTTKLMSLLVAAFINAFLLAELSTAMEDSSIYIYGTITTLDDTEYTGQIRWGKEEAFWFDFFNGTKTENEYLDYLSESELKDLKGQCSNSSNWSGWNTLKSKSWNWSYSSSSNSFNHSFACQFGDLKTIKPIRGDRVKLTLRNGESMIIEDGSNDIGATVRVADEELGILKIDWDDIESVNFKEAPRGFVSAFGKPLFGKVMTDSKEYAGYIQWDHEERLGNDELNGELDNGSDLDIPFGNIRVIEKTYRGSKVEMASGRSFEMMGTNDVDDDNRGIIVNIPGMGRVDIEWEDFISVKFDEEYSSPVSYADFDPRMIKGSVQTLDGQSLTGEIVFDLDEAYDMEILDGEKEDIDYSIPFRNIRSIEPKSDEKSLIVLNNGDRHVLEASVDVSDENDGVLVRQKNMDEYTYLSWKEIERINLN